MFLLLVDWCDEHLLRAFLAEFDRVSTALIVIFGGAFVVGWLLHYLLD